MKKNDPVTSIMTKNTLTVHAGQKMSEVRKLLSENPLHHVPVVSGTELLGMISTADILALGFTTEGQDFRSLDAVLDHQFSIEDVMKKDLITLNQSDTVRNAAEVLASGSFHSLPVVDDSRNLLGIVTSTDLIRYLVDQY